MKFFDREKEIKTLKEINEKSKSNAQFTVLTGRRRIGKTSLVFKAYDGLDFLYFFVSKKSESELCNDYKNEIENKLKILIPGKITKFYVLFEYLMQLSLTRHLIIFIDEFQEFLHVNPSVYSDMQRIWDVNKNSAHLNLIVCGSVNSLINRIFRDLKEPLYARQTAFLKIEGFETGVLKNILLEYNSGYDNEDLLAFYALTGGVAKYAELLVDNNALTKDKMLDYVLQSESVFLSEGKNLLIEEFGKDYGTYFTILSHIASGVNSRPAIETEIAKEIGGYISRLENDYGIIAKKQPLFEKSPNKNVRYFIKDNFLNFWFRFIFKYNFMLEINAHDRLKEIIRRDWEVYSGFALEKYFTARLIEEQRFTRIGQWWDRKGENEIDVIAADELSKTAEFYEVKRQKSRINIEVLKDKAGAFNKATGGFKKFDEKFFALSLEDM
ncbi:MAG: AAA family ATPase [Bacteroidales bacterium]|nr:AAA family ATPase [Bacteroidales bacterium]